jgi:hypothetical protein
MIVACPECSGPFELRDGDIAELVQLECPHCRFRMILDFAAANDHRLVEPGMRMASGYRSAAEYRRATGPAPAVTAVAAPPPAATAASAVPSPVAEERRIPTTPRPAEPIHAPATTPASTPRIAPARTGETVVGPMPRPPEAARTPEPVPPQPPPPMPEPVQVAEPVRAPEAARAPAPEPVRPEPRIPPHTPPRAAVSAGLDSGATALPDHGELEAELSSEFERPRASPLGMAVLVILLLAAVGLTVASLVQKNTPDPRPLLEDLFR